MDHSTTVRGGIRIRAVGMMATVVVGSLAMWAGAAPAAASQNPSGGMHAESRSAADDRFQQTVEQAGAYVVRVDGGTFFDEERAVREGASAEVLETGRLMDRFAAQREGRTTAAAPQSGELLGMANGIPLWGNWCGPGHGGGNAVDVLDSICRTHDRCYETRSYLACSCDRQLLAAIRANTSEMTSRERAMAAAVTVYFTVSPCNPWR